MLGEKEYLQMCDYSLDLVSRPAKVGDKLVTTKFENSMTRGFAAIEECRRADSHDWHFGLTRRLGPERKGVAMKHLRTACVALAFVATTVSGSAQTSLTPSQNTTTIIPQPAPVMRERIVNPSAGSDIGLGAAEQPPTQNNVFVNGALVVPGAPANTDTVPAKFSAKNADDDELITIAYAFKTLTDDERRAVYLALKDQSAGSAFNADIGTKLPPGIELRPVPEELAARVPQTRDYRYAVATDRVLLVGTGRIVAGVFADAPVSEESVIAAVPLSPSATLSTIVSPASPEVSAPDRPQDSSLPSNSVQAAPNDAITTAAAASARTARTEVPRQPAAPATTATTEVPRQLVAASKKPQRTARSQNRPHRGWYNAYAWRRPADYWRRRGYGHERLSSSW
jgi:hypothetical protein